MISGLGRSGQPLVFRSGERRRRGRSVSAESCIDGRDEPVVEEGDGDVRRGDGVVRDGGAARKARLHRHQPGQVHRRHQCRLELRVDAYELSECIRLRQVEEGDGQRLQRRREELRAGEAALLMWQRSQKEMKGSRRLVASAACQRKLWEYCRVAFTPEGCPKKSRCPGSLIPRFTQKCGEHAKIAKRSRRLSF